MKINSKGIAIIKKFEGRFLASYICPGNVWTIGYGHTKTAKRDMTISEEQCEELLKQDLEVFEKGVMSLGLKFNENQFSALVSFSFNIGLGNLRASTLFKKAKVNVNDPTIKDEFMKWVNAGGKKLNGLVSRRQAEGELYFS